MNGKHKKWREIHWDENQEKRLKHIQEKREERKKERSKNDKRRED